METHNLLPGTQSCLRDSKGCVGVIRKAYLWVYRDGACLRGTAEMRQPLNHDKGKVYMLKYQI
jgi:hypothetical protein